MLRLANYLARQTLNEGARSFVVQGVRKKDELPVVIHYFVTNPNTEASRLARFRHEIQIISRIADAGVMRVLDVEDLNEGIAIILEDWGEGSVLSKLRSQGKMSVSEFFPLAIQAARALAALHAQGITHGNIKPGSFILARDGKNLKLSGFGVVQEITRENESFFSEGAVKTLLPYLSPEQTGRMNRSVDKRSDFYSLGVSFFEMLAGEPPFVADDPLELIHAHIARAAPALEERAAKVPALLAALVAKLLSKTAEGRYQSAEGLAYDLECARDLFNKHGEIAEFALGQRDDLGGLRMPEKLYGREEECAFIMESFERAARGPAQVTLVSGVSGQGKSYLIQELQKPIVKAHGYFAFGKYDLYSRDKPYSAIAQALTTIVNQFLLEDDARIARWREGILKALESSAQVIVNVVPNLEALLGKQPEVPALGPEATETRFNFFFKRFLSSLTESEHPIALFLDDLQWADLGSLRLFEGLLTDLNLRHLHFIGAYRDNEVSASHPLTGLIKALKSSSREVGEIALKPLSGDVIRQMLEDVLDHTTNGCAELASAITQKTRGNPFFAQQLLKTLHEKRVLEYVPLKGWQWDLAAVQATIPSGNVLDLMVAKLREMAPESRGALSVASCLGNTFSLDDVAFIQSRGSDETYRSLNDALASGLLIRRESEFKFQHDRIQEASYSLLSEETRREIHDKAGRMWLERTENKPEQRIEKLFTIVTHLNFAHASLRNREEGLSWARLNLAAATKAVECLAYKSSIDYIRFAFELLGEKAWQENYEIAFPLNKLLGMAYYLSGDYTHSLEVIESTSARARDVFDKAAMIQERMRLNMFLNELEKGVQLGVEGMKLFNYHLDLTPSELWMAAHLVRIRWAISRHGMENLLAAPELKDPAKISVLRTLVDVAPYAFLLGSPAMFSLIVTGADITLESGNCNYTPYALMGVAYGYIAAFRSYDFANRLMTICLRLGDIHPDVDIKSKVFMVHVCFVKYWRAPADDIEESIRESLSLSISVGDKAYGSLTGLYTGMHRILYSRKLQTTLENITTITDFVLTARVPETPETLLVTQNFIRYLQGDPEETHTLFGRAYDHDSFMASAAAVKQVTILNMFVAYRGARLYLEGHFEASAKYLLEQFHLLKGAPLVYVYFTNRLFIALALAECASTQRGLQRRKTMLTLGWMSLSLGHMARNAPENYLSSYTLVRAQIARLKGRILEAQDLFDLAIQQAVEHEWPFYEGLAKECAARFYLSLGREWSAGAYFREARSTYLRWGARGQADRLRERYPQFFSAGEIAHSENALTLPVVRSDNEGIDAGSALKASRAISGEIVLNRLVGQLMRIVLENAGAERAALVLASGANKWIVGADCSTAQKSDPESLGHEPLDESTTIPKTLVKFALRSQQSVVLENAANDAQFGRDSYVVAKHSKSLLCAPLVNRGKVLGAIYLENNLATGVFTKERLETLSILASQAAVSIENALLYASLEEKVQERTTELWKKNKDIQVILENIQQGICTFGEDFAIQAEHSAHLKFLLGREVLAGADLDEVLLTKARLNDEERSQIREACRSILGSDALAYDLNAHLLPKEVTFREGEAEKFLELDWVPIEDSSGEIRRIMLSLRDVTELRAVRSQTETQQRELETIGQLLRFESGQFESFSANSRDLIARCREDLKTFGENVAQDARRIFVHLHTLKGNARAYALTALTDHVHEAEQLYADLRKDPLLPWSFNRLEGDLKLIEKALSAYESIYAEKLQGRRTGATTPNVAIQSFLDRLNALPDISQRRALTASFGALFFPTLEQAFSPAITGLTSLATRLNRLAPEIAMSAKDLRLNPKYTASFEGFLNHLLGNSLDHGLSRSEAGRIEIGVQMMSTHWTMSFGDSGRGLNLEKLHKRGLELGLLSAKASDEACAELIFASGLSTAEQVTQVSGRGVGLEAVRGELEKLGGRIRIEFIAPRSEEFRRFRFVMEFPEDVFFDPAMVGELSLKRAA